MQPGSASGAGASGGNRQLKRWGPIAGIVARRMVDLGDTIVPGAPLLDLVDLSQLLTHFGEECW